MTNQIMVKMVLDPWYSKIKEASVYNLDGGRNER
jgi:hypothetical protein